MTKSKMFDDYMYVLPVFAF